MVVRRKNSEAPRNFDSASRRRHLERSQEIFLAEWSVYQLRYLNYRLLLIPNPSSLATHPDFQTSMESAGSMGSTGSTGAARRIKIRSAAMFKKTLIKSLSDLISVSLI